MTACERLALIANICTYRILRKSVKERVRERSHSSSASVFPFGEKRSRGEAFARIVVARVVRFGARGREMLR